MACSDNLIQEMEYSALFSYVPKRKYSQPSSYAPYKRARYHDAYTLLQSIKNDGYVAKNVPASELIARKLKEQFGTSIGSETFDGFFGDGTILVPIPRSQLMKPDTLWVPNNIAEAMERHGLGHVERLLKRISPVLRSSTSKPEDRPLPVDHYNSLSVTKEISNAHVERITLVDDVITRGHTVLGAASRLQEKYPNRRILAFAAEHTVSDPDKFSKVLDPVRGRITLLPDCSARRDPS